MRSQMDFCIGGRLIEGMRSPLTDYRPVMALTLTRDGHDGREVLIGIRSVCANATHQDVVSVPTKRIECAMLATKWCQASGASHPGVTFESDPLLRLSVKYLLSLKLGLADALESRMVEFSFIGMRAWQGVSLIDCKNGVDITEHLTMINVAMHVERGSGLFACRTASYDYIGWVATERLRKAAVSKDLDDLGLDIDPYDGVGMCIRGLCIDTAIEMLSYGEHLVG